jgi:hypothetical protein
MVTSCKKIILVKRLFSIVIVVEDELRSQLEKGEVFLLVKVFIFYKHPHDMLDRPSYIVTSHKNCGYASRNFLKH